jgi:hypothetical protein
MRGAEEMEAVCSDGGEGGGSGAGEGEGGGSGAGEGEGERQRPQTFLLNCGIILQVEGGAAGWGAGGQWR